MVGAIEFPCTSNAEQLVLRSMALPFNRTFIKFKSRVERKGQSPDMTTLESVPYGSHKESREIP